MSKYLPESELDMEKETRLRGLRELAAQYFDVDDVEFLDEMDDEEEKLSYVVGRLVELGEDPDEVLREFGVIEGEQA